MKRILPILLGLVVVGRFAEAHAVPATVSFAGRLTTSAGPVTGTVPLRFGLFTQAIDGAEVWSETRPSVTASGGLVYVELGALTTLDESVLTDGALFLEIRVGNEILTPRLALQSVPYAIRAEVADRAELLGTIAPADVVTDVTGSAGITATRAGNQLALAANPSVVQTRVTGVCSAGSSIASVSATGAVTCELDNDTTYAAAAGGGLTMNASNGFGLSAACASGQVLKAGAAGTWACAADVDTTTTYTALAGGGVNVAGTAIGLVPCASGQVLKAGATAGSWTCGADTDTNTTYGGGSGLTLTGTTFATDNAVVARKDAAAGDQIFSNRIGLGVAAPREKLDIAGAIRIDGMRVFRKYGNNGTVSCTTFCGSSSWGGGNGACLAAKAAGAYVSCTAIPNVDLACMCVGIDE